MKVKVKIVVDLPLSSCEQAGSKGGNTRGEGAEQPPQQPLVFHQLFVLMTIFIMMTTNYQYCDENYEDQQCNVNIVLKQINIKAL